VAACTRTRAQAQVLARLGDDAHAVGDRVEVEAGTAGLFQRGHGRADRAQLPGGGVERAELPARGQRVQHALRHAVVDADQLLARRQALERQALQHLLRLACVEAEQFGRVGHGPEGFAARLCRRFGRGQGATGDGRQAGHGQQVAHGGGGWGGGGSGHARLSALPRLI
jgi:hypothetical protein